MKTYTPSQFIATFGTVKGRSLANALGISGKGCVERANLISGMAGNAAAAIRCQATHGADPETRASYWAICARIAERMSAIDRAVIVLPVNLL